MDSRLNIDLFAIFPKCKHILKQKNLFWKRSGGDMEEKESGVPLDGGDHEEESRGMGNVEETGRRTTGRHGSPLIEAIVSLFHATVRDI